MGNRIKSKSFDINDTAFLGAGDKHCMYLNHLYTNEITGTDKEKFEKILEILSNQEVQNLMISEDIEMPSDADEINCPGGFFEKLTEKQAQKFYEIIKANFK